MTLIHTRTMVYCRTIQVYVLTTTTHSVFNVAHYYYRHRHRQYSSIAAASFSMVPV
jgi:hypothetical protein